MGNADGRRMFATITKEEFSMTKTLVSALASALVVGATGTTFAAANPFSDVPRDHWAYDAVTQLANDGGVEGYGDGTFRGDRNITRYEMAQMVAKAMAKGDLSASDRALVDRLSVEFADELNSLGVRVSELERNADMVKWNGELRYTYERVSKNIYEPRKTNNELLFRLDPSAEVNRHWTVKARLDAATNFKTDNHDDDHDDKITLKRAYAEGTYGPTVVRLGKQPLFTEQGVLFDDDASGASVTLGTGKAVSATLFAGRYNLEHSAWGDEVKEAVANGYTGGTAVSMQLLNLNWDPSEKFHVGADYMRLTNTAFIRDTIHLNDPLSLYGIGMTYRPIQTLYLSGGYWKTHSHESTDIKKEHLKAYNVELGYKGANADDPGSFGIYAAYRYLGGAGVLTPTFDGVPWNKKGWEFGGQYTPARNVIASLVYFRGKTIFSNHPGPQSDLKQNKFFGRVEFLF